MDRGQQAGACPARERTTDWDREVVHGGKVVQVEFKTGGHGYGLGKPGSEPAAWPGKFVAFAREICGLAAATP